LKQAIKTTHFRVIVKEYDDGSIIEYRFPMGSRSWERKILREPTKKGKTEGRAEVSQPQAE
jgi:hypothetical protein